MKKIKNKITEDMISDLNSSYGLDIVEELQKDLSKQLDKSFITDLFKFSEEEERKRKEKQELRLKKINNILDDIN